QSGLVWCDLPGTNRCRYGSGKCGHSRNRSLISTCIPSPTAKNRQAAMVVHEVSPEFRVQRLKHVPEGNAPLTVIVRRNIGAPADENAFARINTEAISFDKRGRRRACLSQIPECDVIGCTE